MDGFAVDSFESITDISLHTWFPLPVSFDPEVVLCICSTVALNEVNLSFLCINAVHFTGVVVTLLQPTLDNVTHTSQSQPGSDSSVVGADSTQTEYASRQVFN